MHELLGCHLDDDSAHFAVYAPHARAVSVVGDFNDWCADTHPLAPRDDESGLWSGTIGAVRHGALRGRRLGFVRLRRRTFIRNPSVCRAFPCARYPINALRVTALANAFVENFILPLPEDAMSGGKGALLAQLPGDEWQRFAGLRCLYGYLWAFPGKK